MKISIINCHTSNRGDEAAVRALVDVLNEQYNFPSITLAIRSDDIYPNLPANVKVIKQYIPYKVRHKVEQICLQVSKGKLVLLRNTKCFINEMRSSDLILHCPGGPSIGDIYYDDEVTYLKTFDLIRLLDKPYFFYAPSMGPFNRTERNDWRRKILNNSQAIVLRDPISAEHVNYLLPEKEIFQSLDAVLQHDIDEKENKKKFNEYKALKDFMSSHSKCVGVTITDLIWHPTYSKDKALQKRIKDTFKKELSILTKDGFGIIFIPQLYGLLNDYDLMKFYCLNEKDFFIISANDDKYDAYFQQYLIGQLYAVIGMRYHSNIFSAKMGTPFISISYEQKMYGFMEKMKLQEYCINITELSNNELNTKFNKLINHYYEYKNYLNKMHKSMKAESYRTTEILKAVINRLGFE